VIKAGRIDIFIIHSGEDTVAAEKLFDLLSPHCDVFLDSRSIRPGDIWPDELERALKTAEMLAIVLSRNTGKSFYTKDEVAVAIQASREKKRRLVPIYLDCRPGEDVDRPYGLSIVQEVVGNSQDIDRIARKLLELIPYRDAKSSDSSVGAFSNQRDLAHRRQPESEHPPLWLSPLSAHVRGRPRRDIDILDPGFRAVPLVGRKSDLQSLFRWLQEEQKIAVTTLIGPGGSGKTRLAIELLECLPKGWQGGFLVADHARQFVAEEDFAVWSWQMPTLVVVDYASLLVDTLALWFSHLSNLQFAKHALRILLLERHADIKNGWYHDLADDTWHGHRVRELLSPVEPRHLSPLSQPEQRRQILEEGLKVARELGDPTEPNVALPEPGENRLFDLRLATARWDYPLLLLMASLSSPTGGLDATLELSRQDLAKELASRERDRLRQAAQDAGAKELLNHLYACVILCGGLSREDAGSVAESEFAALRRNYPGGSGQAVDDLARFLGASDWLPALTPDMFAEAFLLINLDQTKIKVAGRLASRAPEKMAATLIRTLQDFADEQLPLDLLREMAKEGKQNFSILRSIEENLSSDTLSLRQLRLFAVEVTRLLIHALVTNPASHPHAKTYLPRLWNNLSLRQSSVGEHKDALASMAEAIRLRRELATTNQDSFLSDLAVSLNNLATLEKIVGHNSDALVSLVECVDYYRKLAKANPNAFLAEFARSLNNLANLQINMDQRTEALISVREAVDVLRAESPANSALNSLVALSLDNLADCQNRNGDRGEALKSNIEAVGYYRSLAATDPSTFLAPLTKSLTNLAKLQSAMGHCHDALICFDEAINPRRILVDMNPAAFLPDLAELLRSLADLQRRVGQHRKALKSIEEALNQYRQLAGSGNSHWFLPDVAACLKSRAQIQSSLGTSVEALSSAREAVRILRELSSTNPALSVELAKSLDVFGDCLAAANQLPEARAAKHESWSLHAAGG
jgi:tetratricopeptide (TPR) repeat protein